jgi:hypothetical protein
MTEKEREAHRDKFVAEVGALTSKYFDKEYYTFTGDCDECGGTKLNTTGKWLADILIDSGERGFELRVSVDYAYPGGEFCREEIL